MSDITLKLNLNELTLSNDNNDKNNININVQGTSIQGLIVSPEQRQMHYLCQEL